MMKKTYEKGRIKLILAEKMGFCPGVETALKIAYDVILKNPGKRIYLLDEMIHNPGVNKDLEKRGIIFLHSKYTSSKQYLKDITSEDLVIIPAFGAPVSLHQELAHKGCRIIDTTCGYVKKVIHQVEKYKEKGFTTIMHGKFDHAETISTLTRAGRFIVIRDLHDAGLLAEYIADPEKRDRKRFLSHFKTKMSKGFNPDSDLGNIGMAAQTTMMASEFQEISKILEEAVKYVGGNFESLSTICTATQERQEAAKSLAENPEIGIAIVVGGFNSSNTGNLAGLFKEYGKSAYHIETAKDIGSDDIRHMLKGKIQITQDWLPDGKISIGITSGASTPDDDVEAVIDKLLSIDQSK